MSKKKIKALYEVDKDGRKYIEFERDLKDIPSEIAELMSSKVYKDDGEWSLSSLTSCITACDGMAERILGELKGLSKEEIKLAYNHDKDFGGRDYKSIIGLGLLLLENINFED